LLAACGHQLQLWLLRVMSAALLSSSAASSDCRCGRRVQDDLQPLKTGMVAHIFVLKGYSLRDRVFAAHTNESRSAPAVMIGMLQACAGGPMRTPKHCAIL
jgi:hypothetical protein